MVSRTPAPVQVSPAATIAQPTTIAPAPLPLKPSGRDLSIHQ